MRRFLIISMLLLLELAMLLASTGVALAVIRPFRPGSLFFPVQSFAEQSEAWFIGNPTDRALYFLELAEQRAADLAALAGGEHELVALHHLDESLDQAAQAVSDAPPNDLLTLASRLAALAHEIQAILGRLVRVPLENPDVYAAMQAKVAMLRQMVEGSDGSQILFQPIPGGETAAPLSLSGNPDEGVPNASQLEIDPRAVTFFPGSPGALHAFFPLTGGHSNLDCTACHTNGQYASTPRQCEACHAMDEPANHFEGDCSACHTTLSWTDVNFDHTLARATDCQSCHARNKPANHFAGQCSLCHSTTTWQNATFNHQAVGAKDCQACHTRDKPAKHFSGQCSLCHNTSSWKDATFNHEAAGATDCQACHTRDKPANHFSGQCSLCHNTSSWKDATFNHEAAGVTDCQACHGGDRPENHFPGQCSDCHNTSSWKGASFSHKFPIDHHGAKGDCAKCHPSGTSSWTCYICHDQQKMEKKHAEKGISNISTRCVDCHPDGKKGDEGEDD